jgi:hypothetical protein
MQPCSHREGEYRGFVPPSTADSTKGTSPSRIVDIVVGAFYIGLGLLGLGFSLATDATGILLFGLLPLNPLLSLVHAGLGGVLLLCSFWDDRVAALAASWGGAAMLALGIAGLFLTSTDANVFDFSGAANLLHFATATLLLAVGLGFRRDAAPE